MFGAWFPHSLGVWQPPELSVLFSSRFAPAVKMIKIALGSALASLAAAAPILKDAPIVSGDGEPPSRAHPPLRS